METFSERHGYNKAQPVLQIESINDALRNRLWSTLYNYVYSEEYNYFKDHACKTLVQKTWVDFLKRTSDDEQIYNAIEHFRNHFFNTEWYETYDFIEHSLAIIDHLDQSDYSEADYYIDDSLKCDLTGELNRVLKEELAGYRILDGKVVPISNETEIESIDDAVNSNSTATSTHIAKALSLLSNRENPDYHNSVKESISAVESCVREILGKSSIPLSDGIKEFKDQVDLHPALSESIKKIYAYASDEGGIRHANKTGARPVSFAEAKMILVICSAYVNFLTEKRVRTN